MDYFLKIIKAIIFIQLLYLISCFDCDILQREFRLEVIDGNNQIGISDQQLNDPILVKIVDRDGGSIPNIKLIFEVVEGNGFILAKDPLISNEEGIVEINWVISGSYNTAKIELADNEFEANTIYVYATGDNAEGISVYKSTNSLKKEGDNFYSMSFYGDYDEVVGEINDRLTSGRRKCNNSEYNCSLFSVFGTSNNYLFGRSFDNPIGWECLTLVGKYYPANGYSSIAFSRMQDYGFHVGNELLDMHINDKIKLFESAAFVPDGINECGLVVGVASVDPAIYTPDPSKETLFITVLVRKILDRASNIEEAINIAKSYNLSSPSNTLIGNHLMIADVTGNSAILEVSDGILQVAYNSQNWQVLTNSPSYNISLNYQMGACSRFRYIFQYLSQNKGNISDAEAMSILGNVGWQDGTQWSAVYDLLNRSVEVAIDYNFSNLYSFSL